MLAVWFGFILLVAPWYYRKVRPDLETADIRHGLAMCLVVCTIIVGIIIGITFPQIKLPVYARTFLTISISMALAKVGLTHILDKRFQWLSMIVAFGLALCFNYSLTHHHNTLFLLCNNLLLVLGTLGVGTMCGHFFSPIWMTMVYTGVAIFDAYAVWYSPIMNRIFDNVSGIAPSGIVVLAAIPYREFLGAGDVFFSIFAMTCLIQTRGISRAYCAALGYLIGLITVSILQSHNLIGGTFPFMVVVAPITILSLWLPLFYGKKSSP